MLDEAIAEYEASQSQKIASIESGSAHSMVYNNLAWFYVIKKIKPKEAISLAKKALELDPNNGPAMDTLAWAYLRNGQFDEALKTFSKINSRSIDWRGISEIASSSVNPKAFLQFCNDKASALREEEKAPIHSVLAQFYEHRGEKEKAQEEWAKSGFAKAADCLVLGPFDNTGGIGFSKVYPPEVKIDVHATYQRQTAWKETKHKISGTYIDFCEMFDNNQWKVAYGLARVISPTERKVQLRVGSDDDVKMWLNRKGVLSNNIARSVGIDQDVVPVTLRSGTNEILVKICNRTGDWGFYLRITDMEGKPFDDLKFISTSEMLEN
jgi:hypothetical protein